MSGEDLGGDFGNRRKAFAIIDVGGIGQPILSDGLQRLRPAEPLRGGGRGLRRAALVGHSFSVSSLGTGSTLSARQCAASARQAAARPASSAPVASISSVSGVTRTSTAKPLVPRPALATR